jgi:Pentapeptide repeats (9 copies)
MSRTRLLFAAVIGTALIAGTIFQTEPAGAHTAKHLGKPTDPSALTLFHASLVSWAPPTSDGGSAITKYIVSAYHGKINNGVETTCTTTGTPCLLTGLQDERYKYIMNIEVYNSGGETNRIRINVYGFETQSPVCGYFGPYAELRTCNLARDDLAKADLSNSNLTSTTLTDANLTNVNFTNSLLTSANFSGADLNEVVWSNTTCPDGTNSNNDGDTCVNNLG